MAGKFVSIEEAARLLGVATDEVKRLVERKKLFPLHDGNFKIEEIERIRASLGDDSSLSLDLDVPGAAGDDLAFDLPTSSADAGSQTIVRGKAGAGDGLSGLALTDDDMSADGGDLVLEANPGASSPSLARPTAGGSVLGSAAGGDPLTLDLSNISAGGMPGSQLTGGPMGGLSGPSAAGSGFSAPADSGLSLEEGSTGLDVSGIDLEPNGTAVSGVDLGGGSFAGGSLGGGSLAGDEFNLGEGMGDEDSASVVIATEESGDSSFFANVTDDSASVALDSSVDLDSSSMSDLSPVDVIPETAIDMQFSGWQIAGLTCCALILLTGGIVMYDVLSSIHKPQGTPTSGLLLNAMGQLMGWRK